MKEQLEGRWRELGEFIREQRRVGQLSLRKLSERANVSNPYLAQIERGLRKASAGILQQIAKALEISAETLYVRAGILEERNDRPDIISEIRSDRKINEDQKKTLIRVYESFCHENGNEPRLDAEASPHGGEIDTGGAEPQEGDLAADSGIASGV